LQERSRTALPQYRQLFREAQEKTGIDWRLLAALAYQESKWDPAATSETGVRGFMQITEDTARHLGIIIRSIPTERSGGRPISRHAKSSPLHAFRVIAPGLRSLRITSAPHLEDARGWWRRGQIPSLTT
jgi:hypothetical protein